MSTALVPLNKIGNTISLLEGLSADDIAEELVRLGLDAMIIIPTVTEALFLISAFLEDLDKPGFDGLTAGYIQKFLTGTIERALAPLAKSQ